MNKGRVISRLDIGSGGGEFKYECSRKGEGRYPMRVCKATNQYWQLSLMAFDLFVLVDDGCGCDFLSHRASWINPNACLELQWEFYDLYPHSSNRSHKAP